LTAYHFFDADNTSIFIGEKAIDLHAPVKQVFTTERAVILLDEYGNVSSYQAATAALNWEASLPFITSSSGSLGSARKEALIVPDPDHALIYALFADEIIALDASTGETVWQSGGEHRFDQLTINSADSTLICLEDTVQHLADPELLFKKVYDVVVLDALTGAEKQRCSLNESFERGEPYINSSARDKENHNTALNPNGTLFAGVIYHTEQTEGNIQQYATYYTVDLKKNESRVLYSEKIDSGILWMTVEKSGNKQILSLIRPLKNTKDGLSMKRIDLTAGSVQYDLEALPKDSSFSIQSTQHFSVVEWINGVLLLCADDHFYIVYPQTGEILMQGATEKPVINAWLIDDIYFGFVFDDGSYEICWPGNDEMAHSGKLGQNGSLPLGEITGAYPAGVGFLFPTVADDRIQGCKLDDSIFIAVTDAANSRRVLIKQPAFIDKSAYDTALPINVTAPASPFADGTSVMINRDGAVTLAAWDWNASVYTWYRYAPQTNALETYEYPFEKTVVSAWLLPKSNQLLLHPTEGSVACYDFSTGKTTELGAEKKVVVATGELFGQTTNFWGTLSKAKSVWSSADDRVWTAFCDNKQISIWADGELMQTVALPEGFPWAISHGTHIESIFEIGENGYLLLSNYSSEPSLHIGQFALYSIRENAWTLVEDDAQGDANRTFALAESQDLFAVLEPDRVLRIYDISEQRAIQAVKVPIDMESVSDCRFIGGDGYFAFCTKDGLVEIYAVESGDCVFSGPLPETTVECGRISAHLDEKNGRLYLIEHKNHVGFCFDFSSCTKIGDMTNVYGCDPQTGSLCYDQYGSGLFLRRIPSTEEMVRLGQELLN
ncbi:MAG: PQQ-binding-like beta-propeller repeat protein, partial [Clostridia bacterium]|nr:PQQ-binding-like beta-propeller repeat protein [Clostridia bacterium]